MATHPATSKISMTCLDPLLQPLSHLRNFTMRIRVPYPTIKWKTPIKTRINKTVISIELLSPHDCWSISRCCIFQVAAQAITSARAGPSGTPKGNHFRDRGALSLFKYSVMESWNHEDLESCKVASRILIVVPKFLMIHDFLCLCS